MTHIEKRPLKLKLPLVSKLRRLSIDSFKVINKDIYQKNNDSKDTVKENNLLSNLRVVPQSSQTQLQQRRISNMIPHTGYVSPAAELLIKAEALHLKN
ncbi:unnamed protein product [Cunninghamella echinulata]